MGTPVQSGGTINLNVGHFDASGNQLYPHITGAANGMIFAAWNSDNTSQGAFFTGEGNLWIFTFAFQTSMSSASSRIDVAALDDGAVAVAWQNNTTDAAGDVNIQLLNASGAASPIITQAAAGTQGNVALGSGKDGNVIAVFSGPGASSQDVMSASYNQFGGQIFAPAEISNGVRAAGIQDNPNVAELQNGNLIAVWLDASDNSIRGSRLGDDGFRVGEAFLLASGVTESAANDNAVGVTGLASGDFAVTYRNGINGDLHYRVFTELGAPITAELTPGQLSGSSLSPQIAGLQDGRFVIVTATGTAGAEDIVGQIFNADGTANSPVFTIDNSAGRQFEPSLAVLADGRFAVSYSSDNVPGGSGADVVMKIFDPRESGVTIFGTPGLDDYQGSAFADNIIAGDGHDTVYGNAGNDKIDGGPGNDTLFGGDGNDMLRGGGGSVDTLTGDAGDDRFILTAFNGRTVITDFVAGAGTEDKIDLTAISAIHGFDGLLSHATQQGMDTFIDFANDGRITLVLEHVSKASLSPDDFIFQGKTMFASPTPWTSLEPGQDGWYVGDFNGDHKSDILRSGSSGAEILLSDGVAGFGSPVNGTPAGNGSDNAWHAGDFNGDGKDDIFRFIAGSQSGADVFLSTGNSFGNGTSTSWTPAGAGSDGTWHVGDFNGDGKADIFRYLAGSSGADVFLSNGTSFVHDTSWTPAGIGTDNKWYVGDFNGDGKSDVFRYLAGSSGADVFLSNGTSFVHSGSWTPAGAGSDGTWHVGDFNGDGKADISRYLAGSSGADIFLSNGTSFVHDTSWTPAGIGSDNKWYVGDFNGDGSADLLRNIAGHGADVLL